MHASRNEDWFTFNGKNDDWIDRKIRRPALANGCRYGLVTRSYNKKSLKLKRRFRPAARI